MTRVLTTHVGSLPRPQEVVDVIWAEDQGEAVDPGEYDRVIGEAVRDRVAHQVEAGIDLVSDGEMGKIGYATYIRHRLSGFEVGDVPAPPRQTSTPIRATGTAWPRAPPAIRTGGRSAAGRSITNIPSPWSAICATCRRRSRASRWPARS